MCVFQGQSSRIHSIPYILRTANNNFVRRFQYRDWTGSIRGKYLRIASHECLGIIRLPLLCVRRRATMRARRSSARTVGRPTLAHLYTPHFAALALLFTLHVAAWHFCLTFESQLNASLREGRMFNFLPTRFIPTPLVY